MNDTISWVSAIIFLVILISLVGLAASRKYEGLPEENVEYSTVHVTAKTTLNIGNRIKIVDSKKGYRKRKLGNRGCSAISQAILEDYGAILSRSERRKIKPFVAYYNMR